MLFTYTPTEQTEEVIKQVNLLAREAAVRCSRRLAWSNKPNNDFLFSFTSSWCRELTVRQILNLVGPLPPGKLNMYGIRKHDGSWSNQPRDTVGKIGRPNRRVNTLFTNLFEFMTEMFSYILETEQPMKSHTPEYWLSRLASGTSHFKSVDSKYPVGRPECLLNLDTDAIPVTSLWETDIMFGTVYNIPSEWVKSQAIMSYLLYLPRIWGAFYEDTNLLVGLSRLGRLRYNDGDLTRLLYPGEKLETNFQYSIDIWRHIVKRLMLPMWFTEYGRMDFWIFTYLVIREGLAIQAGSPRIPEFREALTSTYCSGFKSWLRKYRCQPEHDAPDWVSGLYDLLQECGPYAMLKTKAITSYI